jgi:hypothetical protein
MVGRDYRAAAPEPILARDADRRERRLQSVSYRRIEERTERLSGILAQQGAERRGS